MADSSYVKIDAYSHVSPRRYTETLGREFPDFYNQILGRTPAMFDMDTRFRVMDAYGPMAQVLTVGPVPGLEELATPKRAAELAKMANDEMAELIDQHPDRFVAAIAILPMNNIDAAIEEGRRTIEELGFKGLYVHSNINGKPLDDPEFLPLFEMLAEHDLPLYIHPWRGNDCPEYSCEDETKYGIASTFGWPYETTAAMTRIVFSGHFEKFPGLKVVTHHLGGMVSFYSERIVQHYGQFDSKYHDYTAYMRQLTKPPIDYFKMFYADTAIHGNTPALMLGYSFWGADHIVFGADMPLGDPDHGMGAYKRTLDAIEAMDITEAEKKMILRDNAVRLLNLEA